MANRIIPPNTPSRDSGDNRVIGSRVFDMFISCCCTLPLPRIYIPPRRISETMSSTREALLFVQGNAILLFSAIIRYSLCTVYSSIIDDVAFLGWNDIITALIIILFRRGGCQSSGSWLMLACIWGPISIMFDLFSLYINFTTTTSSSNWKSRLSGSNYTYWVVDNILLIICGIILQTYLVVKCYKLIKELIPDWISTLTGDDPRYE